MIASVVVTACLALCQAGTPSPAASARDEPTGVAPALWRESESAADEGLRWLAEHQSEHGYWQAHVGHKRQDNYVILRSAQVNESLGQGHMGVTALAGLAFLAGGHLPDRGRYGKNVRRVVDYVCDHVEENGLIRDGGTRMYSHAFATLFLAEVYGMTHDKLVRVPLERAVHIIVDCQNAQGGWRYNAFSREADLSVTVCQVQALRAARNIGLQVPRDTIKDAIDFVRRARTTRGPSQGLFYYKNAGRSARTKNREYSINAAALTALYSAGISDPNLIDPALEFLDEEYGSVHDYAGQHYYYWYGNYYACQAFFQAGGSRFDHWHDRMCRDLLRSQRREGHWVNSIGPGDAFSTAVACLVLQIRKQFLPIFQR